MKVYNYLQQQILEIRYVLTVKLHWNQTLSPYPSLTKCRTTAVSYNHLGKLQAFFWLLFDLFFSRPSPSKSSPLPAQPKRSKPSHGQARKKQILEESSTPPQRRRDVNVMCTPEAVKRELEGSPSSKKCFLFLIMWQIHVWCLCLLRYF